MIIDELGLNLSDVALWFAHEQDAPYVLVEVSQAHCNAWAAELGMPVRRCYVSDAVLAVRANKTGLSVAELIAARLPDAGSTMAGDFGEILVYMYQSAMELPKKVIGPKKWQLKQDRTKPAPYSDVLQFVLTSWPTSTVDDEILCSEVKTKSTDGASTPITSAIEDSEKDRTSRLAKTLVWLRERAYYESLGEVEVGHLNRFINATDHPPARRRFQAVAVICASLVTKELKSAPKIADPEYTVIVLAVPNLKDAYSAIFESAKNALLPVSEPAIAGASAPAASATK